MGLFNFKREIKWDKDVMKVTDSLSSIWDSVVNEMSDKMKNEQTSEVLRHFDIDMSELREYLCDKEEWRRKQEAAMPKWIPVTEQKPEKHKTILAYNPHYSNPYTCRWDGRDWWLDGGFGVKLLEISHWMPLPEPPKEEDDDATK